jgi:hypothetical protein
MPWVLGLPLYKSPSFFPLNYTIEVENMEDKIISFMGTSAGFALYGAFIYLVAYTIAGPAA